MQQLLIDTMDLLDPEHARVAKSRRTRLMPIEYGPLPALSEYQRKLRVRRGLNMCPNHPSGHHLWTVLSKHQRKLLVNV